MPLRIDAVFLPYYDSIDSKKLIVKTHRTERDRPHEAVRSRWSSSKASRTSIQLHRRILADPDCVAGKNRYPLIEIRLSDKRTAK